MKNLPNWFVVSLALLVVLFLGWSCRRTFSNSSYYYRETDFEKEYTWQDVEVGTVIRWPAGKMIRNGRYSAVLAIQGGNTNETRILLRGPMGEGPIRSKLISTNEQMIVYQVGNSDVTIDLSRVRTYPIRDLTKKGP